MPYKDPVQQREYQAQWVAARREKAIRARGHLCFSCGNSDGPFEFDHVDRKTKVDHRIWSWSWARIEDELAKCQLLCHECHIEKTGEERGWGETIHGTATAYKSRKCRCEECRRWNREYEAMRRAGG